ncbi:MAG: hypothetical protein PVH37_12865, partial [Desulfobacterales bacterium]
FINPSIRFRYPFRIPTSHFIILPHAPCPLPFALRPTPYALSPMPHALCLLPYALSPMPHALCHSLPHPVFCHPSSAL